MSEVPLQDQLVTVDGGGAPHIIETVYWERLPFPATLTTINAAESVGFIDFPD
jgi:hypothetical protein